MKKRWRQRRSDRRQVGGERRAQTATPFLKAAAEPAPDGTQALKADVVIFGAGIAGLTAAHELAERNFKVVVVDPDLREGALFSTTPDDDNPGLGGMARTQWRYLRNRAAELHVMQLPTEPANTLPTLSRPFRSFLVQWHLTRGDVAVDLDSRDKVDLAELCREVKDTLRADPKFEATLSVTPRALDRDEFAFLVEGFEQAVKGLPLTEAQQRKVLDLFDFGSFEEYIRDADPRWNAIAAAIREALGDDPDLEDHLDRVDLAYDYEEVIGRVLTERIVGPELAKQLFHVMLPDDANLAGTAAVESNTFLLPGEHGFRFFPSFYRHLFDTMRRTPRMKPRQRIGDEFVRAELGTVFDNLVPAERLVLSSKSPGPSIKLLRRDGFSQEKLREFIKGLLREAGYDEADLLQLTAKFIKYLTSSRRRRETEYEGVSWSTFVEADRMSKRGRFLTETIPGTLVGLRGSASDARTQGTIAIQCMLDQFTDGSRSDMLLNGPTDTAWLGHWHRYLASQHVTFRNGKLVDFRPEGDKMVPIVEIEDGHLSFRPGSCGETYYILALPLADKDTSPGAAKLARTFCERAAEAGRDRPGDMGRLWDFAGNPDELQASVKTHTPNLPLRHLSGIQYFFSQELRLWRGHTQYLDAPAGLTAIAQPQFWADPRNLLTGYRSVLSVDIGTFWPPEIPGVDQDKAKYPWNKSHQDIASLVWKQLVEGHTGDFKPEQMPRPAAFHIDENLVLENGVVSGNDTPYLVNATGKFRTRPGLAKERLDDTWRAKIEYEVAAGQYVLAGTHMQTFTRITSMESACESGRHAVNAVLKAMGMPGEHCEIWDPEDYEPEIFQMAKELDERLCARGARHAGEGAACLEAWLPTPPRGDDA